MYAIRSYYDCASSIAFCTGTTYTFPTAVNNGSAPVGPEYGCLSTQPNPVYYYLQIATAGSLSIQIASDCGDVDYAAWGPFPAQTCDPADLTATGNPGTGGNYSQPYGNMVDCAYSTSATEVFVITSYSIHYTKLYELTIIIVNLLLLLIFLRLLLQLR